MSRRERIKMRKKKKKKKTGIPGESLIPSPTKATAEPAGSWLRTCFTLFALSPGRTWASTVRRERERESGSVSNLRVLGHHRLRERARERGAQLGNRSTRGRRLRGEREMNTFANQRVS